MPLTYRFCISGQMDVEALNEADAREKLKQVFNPHTHVEKGAFVLAVPTSLMMVLEDGREVSK